MPILHAPKPDVLSLVDVTKNGEEFLIVCDYKGIQTYSRQQLRELISTLQRTLEAITDEELQDYTQREILDYAPSMYLQTHGEGDPLWQEWLLAHPDYGKKEPPAPCIPRKGFVYVVQADTAYKIGCTGNLPHRLKLLAVTSRFPLHLRCLIPSNDIEGTERELHQRFAEKRVRGEWFALLPDDLARIRQEYPTAEHVLLHID